MRDLFKALLTMTQATPEIFALVEDRIWINEIPEDVIEKADTREPPKMLVIRQGGGGAQEDILPIVDRTVITLCYGETDHEADRLLRAVAQRWTLLAREIHNEVLLHHINPTGGPIPSVEPDLVWPAIAQSWTTKADILEVA
ncbi:MAG: hypothetical protein GY898_23245 [Proteobacteria bacterium]|nr:hypothetical protein [Pseudomonadota bacterium]